MKNIIQTTTLAGLLALALAPNPIASAADSADRAQAAKAKMDSTRAEVAKIRHQVGLTLEELNRLQKENMDLRTQFQKFSAELVKMEVQAQVARDRAFSMEEKGQAFFQAWEDQIKSIANADIRDEAMKRYSKRAKSYGKILRAMFDARDQLQPFMSDLNDIKKLLDSELTRASVGSTKTIMKQANWHGADVVDSIEDVEKELDRVSTELAKYE
jgi:regulator of replication initiation timing/ribosomal protein L25 (general stress protein Ctc)